MVKTMTEEARAREYAELEFGGELRAFEHADSFGFSGSEVQVYMVVCEDGTAFWAVDGVGILNLYEIEQWPNIEGVVQAHADVERGLFGSE